MTMLGPDKGRRSASAMLTALLLPQGRVAFAADRIVIGRSVALSGPLKNSGEAKRNGADSYIRKVNARGGISGRAIEVVTLDDAYEPATTVSNLRRLANERSPVAFLGLFGLPTSAAALPVLEQLRIPAVGLTSGASDLRSPFKQFVFPVRASFSDEARRVVLHLKTIGVSRIAVAYTDNAFGQGVETTTLTATENAGIEALAVGMDPAGTNASTVSRRIQAAEPQVVVLAMANQAAVALVTQLRRASYHGAMYAFSAVDASIIGRQLGDEARGLAITRVVPPPNTIQVRVVAEYLSILKEFNAGPPSFFGLEGFLEAKVLIGGLRRAGTNPSPMALIAGLESMRDYDLGGFFVSYQSGQHTGSTFAEIDVINAAGGLTR
jgi:branched-chain amino acid transport system substrate-binding protein